METVALLGRSTLIVSFILFIVAGLLRLRPGFDKAAPQKTGESAANAWSHRLLWVSWGLVSAATALLVGLFLTDAFSFVYVSGRSNRAMETVYKITALWAGQEGSLLLWLWIQSGYALIVSHRAMRGRGLDVGAAGILSLISSFFALLVAFIASPFVLHEVAPLDGAGMNPILQSYWMTAHPVMLYFGYVGLAVPFAYGLSSLIHKSDAWIRATRRWSLIGWTFLSIGILFGARWAYEELGWGGYWGWDPVENASFMPWLVATAFIHSGLIQEKRGMLKRWNHALIFVTYLLTIFGTFITRSGILASVHAFVESDISPWFIGFSGILIAGYLYGLTVRWNDLKDERTVESPLSKESTFLANNVVFLATTFAIFWGTVFPLISSAFGRQVTVGAPYFDRVTGPLFWIMIVLMGVGPLIAWRRASTDNLKRQFTAPLINAVLSAVWLWIFHYRELVTLLTLPAVIFVITTIMMEFSRGIGVRMRSRGEPIWTALFRMMNRSPGRYGGYVVHLGILLIVVGIVASGTYQQERSVVLGVGEGVQIGAYTVSLYDVRQTMHGAVPAVEADLLVQNAGGPIGFIRPSKRFYPGSAEMGPTTEVAVYGTAGGDLYAVLAGWEPFGSLIGFKFYFNPLMWLLWTGGGLLIFGGLFAFWPRRKGALSESEHALVSLAELEYDYQMGKVNETEYQALFVELSGKAESYVQLENETTKQVLDELEEKDSSPKGGRRGGGAALLLLITLLSASVSWGVPAVARAQDASMPFDVGAAIPNELIVTSIRSGRLHVLNQVTVRHIGDAIMPEVHLSVPANAMMTLLEPADLEPVEDGRLVDPRPFHPGETRRYTLQYEVPVARWPYAFQKDVLYPTAEITIFTQTDQLRAAAIDLVEIGQETVEGFTVTKYQSEWIDPEQVWQAVLKPTSAMRTLPGWDPRIDALPVIAEADDFPGAWLVYGFMGLAPWLRLVIVAAGVVLVVGLRRRTDTLPTRQRGTGARDAGMSGAGANRPGSGSPEKKDTEVDRAEALVRAIARLDIAYDEGALPKATYRKRRKALVRELHGLSGGGLSKALSHVRRRLEKESAGGTQGIDR